jgi:hypothetical protein
MKNKSDISFIFDKLIACDPMVRQYDAHACGDDADVHNLTSEMQRLNIAKAIVRNNDCLSTDPYFCNDVLMKNIRGRDNLIPAWFLTPGGSSPSCTITDVIEEMLRCNVKLAWTDPLAGKYDFKSWCCEEMLSSLQEHLLPLLISFKSVNLSDLHDVMTDFPRLRVVLLDLPRTGRHPMIEALLKAHTELYLCFSTSFAVHGGYRNLCMRYGDHRWVWGMCYPVAEGGSAITGLVYSGLTEKQINAVTFKNIERLLSEVNT